MQEKFQGYMQALTNASDRLNEVHREEVGSLYFALYVAFETYLKFQE